LLMLVLIYVFVIYGKLLTTNGLMRNKHISHDHHNNIYMLKDQKDK
jgi:hypothetical protein